jgi:hypothetical protein
LLPPAENQRDLQNRASLARVKAKVGLPVIAENTLALWLFENRRKTAVPKLELSKIGTPAMRTALDVARMLVELGDLRIESIRMA